MVKGFTKKKKDVNLGIIKNAFAYNVLIILNEGQRNWEGNVNTHKLVNEIESQRYKPYKPVFKSVTPVTPTEKKTILTKDSDDKTTK